MEVGGRSFALPEERLRQDDAVLGVNSGESNHHRQSAQFFLDDFFLLSFSSGGSPRKCRTLAVTSNFLPSRSRVSLRSCPGVPSSSDQTCPMVESGTGTPSTATR